MRMWSIVGGRYFSSSSNMATVARPFAFAYITVVSSSTGKHRYFRSSHALLNTATLINIR